MTARIHSITDSLAAPASLAPYLADLFKGIPSLGSSPRLVTRLLMESGITRSSIVLDLACGKGTLAITIAKTIGCKVHAIDAHQPFIQHARGAAHCRKLDRLATFECADLSGWKPVRSYDAVTMLGLWSINEASFRLRSFLKPRAIYIVDDLFFDPSRAEVRAHAKRPPTLDEVESMVARHSDAVERVYVPTPARVAAHSARLIARLERNAEDLAAEHPRLGPALTHFVVRHRRAARSLTGPFRPAIWIVRKGPRRSPRRAGL